MKNYEAMFLIRPDLSEEERKTAFNQISDAITKHHGTVSQAAILTEKKKLFFPLKKYTEALYYLVSFSISPLAIKDITHAYSLNEFILRLLVSKVE
jgi:small subunit ribosomal protein S6